MASAPGNRWFGRNPAPRPGASALALLSGLLLAAPVAAQFAPVSVQRGTPQMAGLSSRPIALDRQFGVNPVREVVFQSSAATLVVNDQNGASDVFLKTSDPANPHLLVSRTSLAQANGASTEPDATPDGRFVVFTSAATNLVAGDTNTANDIFLRDVDASENAITRISVASDGTQAAGASARPAISANGRVIAFVSSASNLVPNDTNNGTDVFVRDLDLGTTTRVSVRSDGSQALDSGTGVRVDLSADGRHVVFSSVAPDLVASDLNGVSDVFVHDRRFGTTQRVSLNTIDGDPNGPSINPVISADGRFVAFESLASNLVLSDSNNASDVFVRTLPAARTERVSVSSTGLQGNGASGEPSISADGRFVAFASVATNLGETTDTNSRKDVFLRDREGETTRSRVQGNGDSGEPSVSGDGRSFAFTTAATDLGVSDGNGSNDVWRALGRPDVTGSLTAVTPPLPRAAGRFTVAVNAAPGNGIGPVPRGALEVRVMDGGSPTARCVTRNLDNAGNGSCELSVDLPGTYVVELGFLGDANYAVAPLLASGSLTVGPAAPSTLSIAVHAPEPSLANRRVYVQADLQPRGGQPGGIITFSSPAGNCIAELPLSGCLLPFGDADGQITATYAGDGTFSTAAAAPVDQRVSTSIWQRLLEAAGGSGRGPGGPAGSSPGDLSADGRWFVFSTEQPHLVPGDSNEIEDVFLLDQRLGLIRKISRATNGGLANGDSVQPTISGDGRWVAFLTYASNVLPGDTNGRGDVVIVDVQNDSPAELVSVSTSGGFSVDTAFQPRLNHDGTLVAFHSRAGDLIVGDTNSRIDVFVRDRRESTTTRVSVASNGVEGSGGVAGAVTLDLSPDGRYVLFQSDYTNLVPGDTNGRNDVFRHDRYTGRTLRASIATDGTQSSELTLEGSLSPDGDRVVFHTRGVLAAEDTNGLNDVYLHEFSSRSTRLISRGAYGPIGTGTGSRSPVIDGNGDIYFLSDADEFGAGGIAQVVLANSQGVFLELISRDPGGLPGNTGSGLPSVAENGAWVSFATTASNLDPNAPLGGFMLAPAKGPPRAVQRAPVGPQPDGPSFLPRLSGDGKRAAFVSAASNLGVVDENGFEDVYWMNLDGSDIRLLSRSPLQGSPANAGSFGRPALSRNGNRVAFTSLASNLVPGDTNQESDVFLADVAGNTLQRVSVANGGAQAAGSSFLANLSADGNLVLFFSSDPALDAAMPRGGPMPGPRGLYLRDVVGGSTTLLSVDSSGTAPVNTDVFSADGPDDTGCKVVFITPATNVVPGVSDGLSHLYLRDRCKSTTRLLDKVGETVGDGDVIEAVLSRNGNFVAFWSDAGNLVDGVPGPQVYHLDLGSGTITVASRDPDGGAIGNSVTNGLSIDDSGRFVAFTTGSGGRGEPGPGNTEVFVRDTVGEQTATAGSGPASTRDPALSGNGTLLAFTGDDDQLAVGDRNGLPDVLVRGNPLAVEVYTVGDVSVPEGDAGVTEISVPITLTGGSGFPVTVDIVTSDGSAVAPGDYQAYSAPLVFNSDGTQTVTIIGIADSLPESDEDFTVRVRTQGGSPVTLATGTVTLLNDDMAVNVCTRTGAGAWNDATRWTCSPTAGVSPGPGDTAIFDTADDAATLTEPVAVATLELRAGLIDGPNALTVSSQFLWSGGTLDAPDTFIPITLEPGCTSTLSGGAKTLRRRQLVNQGDLTWSAGTLTLEGASTEFRNEANVIIDVASGTLRLDSDGAGGQFFHHTFGSDRSVIKRGAGRYQMDDRIEFRNGNSVLVEAGAASFTGPGTADQGPYQVDNGGILEFNLRSGQVRSIEGPVSGSGALLKVGQGEVRLSGSFGAEGASVQDGSLVFQQSGTVNLTHLLVGGDGTLGGTANLQAQRLTWTGGRIIGPTGSTLRLLGSGVNASALGGVTKCLEQRELVFAGTAAWSGGNLCLRSAARVSIDSGATLDVNLGSTTGLKNDDGSAVVLLVQGVLNKTGDVLDSDVATTVNGTFRINGGALTQRTGLDGTGSLGIAATARLQFAPTATVDIALPFTGNGDVATLSGTTRFLRPLTGNTLSLLVQGSGTARVEAPMALRGLGVTGGSLQLLQSVGAAAASIYSGGTIQISAGTLDIGGALTVNVAAADRLISCESGCSGGAVRLLAGADVGINGSFKLALTGGLPLFVDDPAARLAIGTGATLELSGSDQIRRGSLVVNGQLTRSFGALGVGAGTDLVLSGTGTLRATSAILLNAAIAPGGAGSIGQLTLDGPTAIDGGELRMELASAASFDRIVMAGTSSIALNPAAQLRPGGPYTPAASDVFPLIQHASGARTGTLTLIGGAPSFGLEYAPTRVEYRQPAGPRSCRFNVASGIWDDPANWVCTPAGGFPGEPDTAIVDNAGAVDQNGSRTVAGLQLANGSIRSTTHPLIVTGSFSWTGGRFTGTSDTSDFVRIESTATSVTLGGVQKTLTERELRLDVDATWTTGLIELGSNGQLVIFPGRTLTTTPNTTPPEFVFGSGAGARVNNQGRLLKTGPGRSGIESSVLYEGAGALEVAAGGGEFFLHAPSSFIAGELRTATGGRLVFANSDQSFAGTARLLGTGEVQFGRDTPPTQIDGGTGLHRVPAAAFNLSPGAGVTVLDADLRIEAPGAVAFERLSLGHPLGVLSGDTVLSVTQSMTWSAGTIAGGGDPSIDFDVASTATATLPGTGLRNLTRTLDVAGTLVVQGGTLRLDGFNEIRIQSGALLRLSGSDTSTLSAGGGYFPFPLQNSGRIERQGGGTTVMSMGLQQDNEVVIDAGGTLEVADFATGPAARFVVNGTLRHPSLLAFGGGSVEGTGTLEATVVDNIAADFRPAGTAAGTLTVNGEYRQQSDGRLSLDLLGTGCANADRLVATGSASLAGGLMLGLGGGCTPTPPQEFLLLDAASLTGTFTGVTVPANYRLEYLGSVGEVRLRPNLLASLITITGISPRPTPVGQPYTVTLSVGPLPSTGPAPTGTVLVSAAAPFASESCTITLPATSCTMPAATLPGVRTLNASYSGDSLYLPSSASTTHPVRATPTLSVLAQTPASTVVGEPFAVRVQVANPLSALTPTGEVQVRPLPLGEAVRCNLVQTTPGIAEATCTNVISPIAAAKLLDIRYLGAEDQTFEAAATSTVQPVAPANTTLTFTSSPNPSTPGGAVQVNFTLAAALPSLSPLSALTGQLSVGDGVSSCTATLPATTCTLTLGTLGVRQLRARYLGDANFNPSAEVIREHLVVDGGAELLVRKRNLLRNLPGGDAVVYVIEVENRGPQAVTALVRDPVPTGLSNFRWTCTGEGGAVCPASGTGALNENVVMPVNSLARFVLTADVQRDPEVTVIQEARIDPPSGVVDPNPANNVARDVDPIGLLGDGFEGAEPE